MLDKEKTILLAPGSPNSNYLKSFKKLIEKLKTDLGQESLDIAYFNYTNPGIENVILKSYQKGFKKINLLPLFLDGGNELRKDLPKILFNIYEKAEDIDINVLNPIGSSVH